MKSNRIVNRLNRIAFIGLALALSFMCAAQTRPQAKSKSPKAVTDNRTNRLTQKPAPSSLGRINSRSDFDLLARVYYVNSRAYQFHKDFVNATYLSLERGRAFYDNNFLKPDRRFILGTIAYQTSASKFTFEFWEGDQITASLLGECYAALIQSFYAPLFLKPNSEAHERIARQLNDDERSGSIVPVLNVSELAADQTY